MIISDDNNIEKKKAQKALRVEQKATLSASSIKNEDSYEKNVRRYTGDNNNK